ncbi:MAG: BatD family protein [Gammaproteobacteria bacterium]|nr:BatD family protein [Gammaproteobacteria bacterium]
MFSALRLLIGLALISLAWPAAAEPAAAYLERNPIQFGETVRLVIETAGAGNEQNPDLRSLQEEFTVLGTSTSTQISVINGQQTNKTQWFVELEPKRDGVIAIPPLAVGRLKTAALTLRVLPAVADVDSAADLLLEASLDRSDPYVQSQVVLTLRLYSAVDIIEGSLAEPQIESALVERVGKDTSYESLRGGRRYRVVERRYAVFPQSSGDLTVPAVSFVGRVADPSKRNAALDRLFELGKRVRARSKPVLMSVRPKPDDFDGVWLPARALTLTESWSRDPPEFRAGEPITRSITLQAVGLGAAQLPDAPTAAEGLKAYPDKPLTNSGWNGEWMTGTREQRVAIVPSESAVVTLPEIRIPWWNVIDDREEVAVIAARQIAIGPAAVVSDTIATDAAAIVATAKAGREQDFWRWSSIALLILWATTLLIWYRSRHPKLRSAAAPEDASISKLRRDLDVACRTNDSQRAAELLLRCGAKLWPADTPRNLGQLALLVGDAEFTAAIEELEAARYRVSPANWNGAAFWAAAAPLWRTAKPSAAIPDSALPSLHPASS